MGEQEDSREWYDLTRADRERTLQELEGRDWGEPKSPSCLVATHHRLRQTPLQDFAGEDLRLMIGQGMGLSWLVRLALERRQEDPLIEGDLYPGELLGSVTGLESGYWRDRSNWVVPSRRSSAARLRCPSTWRIGWLPSRG